MPNDTAAGILPGVIEGGLPLTALLIWNILVFILYAADKASAKTGGRRIPEKTLLLCTFLFGGAGALLGMQVVRHKTKHLKFQILVPLALVVQLILLVVLPRL